MTAEGFVPVRADLPNAAKLAVVGAVSGVIAWVIIDASDSGSLKFDVEDYGIMLMPIAVYPGLVFGLLAGVYLRYRIRISGLRTIGYVLAAGLGYFAAFHVAFYIINAESDEQGAVVVNIISGVAAGFAGSLLLGLLSKFLLRMPARLVMGLPLLVGTASGAFLALTSFDHNGWTFLAFFVLWQAAYGASLAPLLRTRAA